VLNSFFGKLGDPYSSLYDPSALLAVTLSGQLMLTDLIERLTEAGVKLISANTDGLFLQVPRGDRSWRDALAKWQADTGMSLDIEPLKRLAVLATNQYATRGRGDNVKRRGGELRGTLDWSHSANLLVVNDAVANALLFDIPPERSIFECRELVRFCSIATRGTAAELVLVDGDAETALPKVTRWYRSKEGSRRIERRFPDGRRVTVPGGQSVTICQDLPESGPPADLDWRWYLASARRTIQKVPGYRHRSRRRLLGHNPALEVEGLGLLPVPKRGKEQLAGSDVKRPTLLWDWPSCPTVGCYTGPEAGTLVLDVDDPIKFSRFVEQACPRLLKDPWETLKETLVSYHGDATPDGVRSGRQRGKLIFKLKAGEDHPLVRVKSRWKKTRGVEVFYGNGLPSILGQYDGNGDRYQITGTLGEAPEWLLGALLPKQSPHRKKPTSSKATATAPEDRQAALEGLPAVLAELAPELGNPSVGWRRKDVDDDREIWVGRCPFEHDSGRSGDADLDAGYHEDGPYVRCLHGSCARIKEINQRLRERHDREHPAAEDAVTEDFTLITTAEWPAPPGEAAFHGLAGEVVRVIEPSSESDPIGVLLQLIIGIGNAVGRGTWVEADGHRHYPNEYGVIVGDTSRARKGTGWRRVRTVLSQAEPIWAASRITSGLSSGEGLIWEIRDPVYGIDKKTGDPTIVDQGVEDKRVLVVESEFGNVLRVLARQGNTLSGVLRLGFDGDDLRTMVKNNPARATNPHVSLIAHITRQETAKYLDHVEIFNGLGNRILWACVRRSKLLPFGGSVDQSRLVALGNLLADAVTRAWSNGPMGWAPSGRALWESEYGRLTEDRPGLWGAITSRAEAHVLRLAMLYAIMDMQSEIADIHVLAALDLWRYCDRSALHLFGGSTGDRHADAILSALRLRPDGMSRTEISVDVFNRHQSSSEIARALSTLLELHLVRTGIVQTEGRPEERWFAENSFGGNAK
jgi:hypothetical protein